MSILRPRMVTDTRHCSSSSYISTPGSRWHSISMRPVASNCSSGSRAWLPPSSEGVYERCGGSAGYGWDIIYWQSPSKMCSWKHWLQGYCAAKAVTKQKPAINIGGDTGEGSPFIQISGAGGGGGSQARCQFYKFCQNVGRGCSEQCSEQTHSQI